MSETEATVLEEIASSWRPPTVETARRVDPWASAAFAALLDADPPALDEGDPLPPLWHWFTLLDHPATAELGEDGHPANGPFLPPIPGRRRMFAGGRLRRLAPIPYGSLLHSRASVASVTPKSGRSGAMLFSIEGPVIIWAATSAGRRRRSSSKNRSSDQSVTESVSGTWM